MSVVPACVWPGGVAPCNACAARLAAWSPRTAEMINEPNMDSKEQTPADTLPRHGKSRLSIDGLRKLGMDCETGGTGFGSPGNRKICIATGSHDGKGSVVFVMSVR